MDSDTPMEENEDKNNNNNNNNIYLNLCIHTNNHCGFRHDKHKFTNHEIQVSPSQSLTIHNNVGYPTNYNLFIDEQKIYNRMK